MPNLDLFIQLQIYKYLKKPVNAIIGALTALKKELPTPPSISGII